MDWNIKNEAAGMAEKDTPQLDVSFSWMKRFSERPIIRTLKEEHIDVLYSTLIYKNIML